MNRQATRANFAQIEKHISRQRAGISGMEFAESHPVLDAILGTVALATGFGGMIAIWIYVGAGL